VILYWIRQAGFSANERSEIKSLGIISETLRDSGALDDV